MNVNEMNTRIESMSQTFRCLNGLNRYRREVDRHQNISNAQFFHRSKVDHQRRINLSLLVKGNSFLRTTAQLYHSLAYYCFAASIRKTGRATGAMPEHLCQCHPMGIRRIHPPMKSDEHAEVDASHRMESCARQSRVNPEPESRQSESRAACSEIACSLLRNTGCICAFSKLAQCLGNA